MRSSLRNLPAERSGAIPATVFMSRQEGYLRWVENAESQLGNFADERDVSANVHTRFYWAIREADPTTPRGVPLIETEIGLQKAALLRIAEVAAKKSEGAREAAEEH